MRQSLAARTAQANAVNGRLNNAILRVYSGTQPASPDAALSGNTLLSQHTCAATFGVVSTSGSNILITPNAIGSASASATGTATFARLFQSDGTTAEHDFQVGAGSGEINLNTTSINSGVSVQITGGTITFPIGTP